MCVWACGIFLFNRQGGGRGGIKREGGIKGGAGGWGFPRALSLSFLSTDSETSNN